MLLTDKWQAESHTDISWVLPAKCGRSDELIATNEGSHVIVLVSECYKNAVRNRNSEAVRRLYVIMARQPQRQ